MKNETSEVQEGVITSNIFHQGLFLSLGMILIGVIQLSCSGPSRGSGKRAEIATAAMESANAQSLICRDAVTVDLRPKAGEKTIVVKKSCLYGKINPKRLGKYELKIDLPKNKSVKYYIIDGNKLVGPLNSLAGSNNEFDFGNTSFAIMGYDGVATLRLVYP